MLVQDAISHRAVAISPHQGLPDAAVLMDTLGIQQLPVVLGGQLVGIITDGMVRRALPALHEGLTPWDAAVRAASKHVSEVTLRPALSTTDGTPLMYVVRMMVERKVGALPVLRADGSVNGILTVTDVLRWASTHPQPNLGAVREAMSAHAISVNLQADASEAAAKFKVSGLRVLPVIDGPLLVGVLHACDVEHRLELAAASHGDTVLADQFFLEGVTVADLMRPPTHVVLGSGSIQDAIDRMVQGNVNGLPVVSDEHRLLGVLTVTDVLQALLRAGGTVED